MLTGTAKLIPCAILIIAVLMPITRPRLSTRGPPELPGLSGTEVWIMFSISRPVWLRRPRPRAEITPVETVLWNPKGLPIAIASWPARNVLESPSSGVDRPFSLEQ